MNDCIIELSVKDYGIILDSPKIDLGNNYIYTGIIDQFRYGEGFRTITSMMLSSKRIDNFIFRVRGNSDYDIELKYSLEDIMKGFVATKYKIGVKKNDVPLLKDYFSRQVNEEEIEIPKLKDISNLPWVDEVRDLVNKDMIKDIISSIPKVDSNGKKLDKLESIIYVYFILCNMFSYDSKFFINRDVVESKHINYANMSNIDKDNSNVVCYEFNMIFALIAEKLGFKASIADLMINIYRQEQIIPLEPNEKLKSDHYSLILSNDKYQVYFDSTRGSLAIDLANVKFGRNVNGIKNCLDDPNGYLNFKVDKIYNLFLELNGIKKSDDFESVFEVERTYKTFKEELDNIKNGITTLEEVSFEEKLDIYLDLAKSLNKKGMDAVSYLYIIFKNLFGTKNDKAHFRIIRTNEDDKEEQSPVVATIFDFGRNTDNARVFIYEDSNGIREISSDELMVSLFNNEYVVFNDKHDMDISCIRSK